jgi:dihydrofolate reductase
MSPSISSLLIQEGLIDEFQIVVNLIVLGKSRTIFEGVKDRVKFKRTSTRTFGNGNTVLSYERAR